MYGNSGVRRKSVFAEAYNPEEDDGLDEQKVTSNLKSILYYYNQNLMFKSENIKNPGS